MSKVVLPADIRSRFYTTGEDFATSVFVFVALGGWTTRCALSARGSVLLVAVVVVRAADDVRDKVLGARERFVLWNRHRRVDFLVFLPRLLEIGDARFVQLPRERTCVRCFWIHDLAHAFPTSFVDTARRIRTGKSAKAKQSEKKKELWNQYCWTNVPNLDRWSTNVLFTLSLARSASSVNSQHFFPPNMLQRVGGMSYMYAFE